MNKLRWGILGAAGIARKNWKAILNSGNGVITAVASRDLARAREFIAGCQATDPFERAPRALGGYEELLAAPDVDAVYVPLPTGLRQSWVVRAAQAGKHVLCEKPCGTSVAGVQEMIEACRRQRVQFMDGVMFMHNPRLERLRAVLDDGKSVGQLRRVTSQFSFLGHENFQQTNIRANPALEPLGCLGDLGWYCVRFALWLRHWEMPREVRGRILSEFAGAPGTPSVPSEFSGELVFNGGVSAHFYCSFLTGLRQWADISGEKGSLRVPDFVLPAVGSDFDFELNGAKQTQPPAAPADTQAARMFHNFATQAASGILNDAWPEWALKTQIVTNALFDQTQLAPKAT